MHFKNNISQNQYTPTGVLVLRDDIYLCVGVYWFCEMLIHTSAIIKNASYNILASLLWTEKEQQEHKTPSKVGVEAAEMYATARSVQIKISMVCKEVSCIRGARVN